MAADLVITGGRLTDAAKPLTVDPVDVVIEDGQIVAVMPAGDAGPARRTLDATGALVMPGFVDIQVHFRTPGGTESEDIASGAAGAAMGGVTACVMMPNTNPTIDSPDMVREVLSLATGAPCDVRTSAAITLGRQGERLTDMAALHAAGVRVFTDDGDCVADDALMEMALAATVGLPGSVVSQHAEDPSMVAGGVINDGAVAQRLGLAGRPAAAEESIVARDLALAATTGGRYHVLHLSTSAAMARVSIAKRNGLNATAEVTPQHLVLTEDDIERLGTTGKMNPPLRLRSDVEALRLGICDGTLDAVATDHAPHHPSLKDTSLRDAAAGMTGVETMASVIWSEMVEAGAMSPARFVEVVSMAPARIAGIAEHGHRVEAGMPANLAVFDPAQHWTVHADELQSRSRNTPWAGRELTGKVRHTVLAGRPVVADGELCS
ncbi:dihydroorotase [Candidatus Poriferisodalis sp.]|uniref:dihydroorotase n=1 Tax=Candidatus Poriferisodalis sp. TaxID=3101277 RepID=UPI003D1205ED